LKDAFFGSIMDIYK